MFEPCISCPRHSSKTQCLHQSFQKFFIESSAMNLFISISNSFHFHLYAPIGIFSYVSHLVDLYLTQNPCFFSTVYLEVFHKSLSGSLSLFLPLISAKPSPKYPGEGRHLDPVSPISFLF